MSLDTTKEKVKEVSYEIKNLLNSVFSTFLKTGYIRAIPLPRIHIFPLGKAKKITNI